jgi:Tol biopolymer transport system component
MTRTVPLLLALLGLLVWLPGSAGAANLPADTTAILSGSHELSPLPAPVSSSRSGRHAVSHDGRFVAFSSTSDGLSNEDDDLVENVYVKDNLTGTVTLVSRRTGANGAPATANCFDATISDNGKRVGFTCEGSLDDADTNDHDDVYLRDLDTNQTILVSRASSLGAVADATSGFAALSEDGTRIAFESSATNLGGPNDGDDAIYVRDVALQGQPPTNGVTLVSRADGAAGALPDGRSFDPSISNDGASVAFESDATNLVGNDTNDSDDVFVRKGNTTLLVSRKDTATGDLGNDDSEDPDISGDGATVVFDSSATNLSPLDADESENIYKRSLTGNTTTLVDQVGGLPANEFSEFPAVNDDGTVIEFFSLGTNLVPGDADAEGGTFVASGGQISIISGPNNIIALLGGRFPSVSGDGKEALFSMVGSLTGEAIPGVVGPALRVLSSGAVITVARPGQGSFANQGGFVSGASESADGRFVALASSAPALGVPGNVPDAIVVRDTVTGTDQIVSRDDGPNGAIMNAFVSDS